MGHSYQPVQFLMKLTYNSRCSRQTLARDSPTGATPEKKNENLGAKPARHRIPTKHEQCLGDALESTVYKAHKYLFAVQLSRVTCPGFEPTNQRLARGCFSRTEIIGSHQQVSANLSTDQT